MMPFFVLDTTAAVAWEWNWGRFGWAQGECVEEKPLLESGVRGVQCIVDAVDAWMRFPLSFTKEVKDTPYVAYCIEWLKYLDLESFENLCIPSAPSRLTFHAREV